MRQIAGLVRYEFSGGGGESKTTVKVPKKTAAELEADELTLRQLRRQDAQADLYDPIIKQYIDDWQAEQKVRQESGVTTEMRVAQEKEDFERSQRMAKVEEELSSIQLEQIKSGGKATPEQIEQINAATGAAQQAGEADIERFRTATLRQINEEVASASGLRPTDTPVLRLSERAGEEATRQQGILTSKLAETNAMARLNFPLAAGKLTSDIAAGQQSLDLAAQNFQSQLRQRAEDNRFRLFQGGQQNNVSSVGFGASLANQRMGARSTTTTTDNGLNLATFGQAAGGVGGLLRGMSSFSDRRLKRDIYRLGELPSGIPVYIFRFIGFDDWHVGVMADEVMGVIPEAVIEHESGFKMVDYASLH